MGENEKDTIMETAAAEENMPEIRFDSEGKESEELEGTALEPETEPSEEGSDAESAQEEVQEEAPPKKLDLEGLEQRAVPSAFRPCCEEARKRLQ